MAKRKKDTMEFRFYELPQGESALVLCGESWKRVYGHEEFHLHFHNLLEIGICREGDGNMYLDEDIYQYHDGDITFIPENFPHVTVSYGEVVNFWEYIFIDIHSVIEEMFPNNSLYSRSSLQRELQDLLNKSKIILLKIKKANNVYYLPSSYKRALCLKQTCIK